LSPKFAFLPNVTVDDLAKEHVELVNVDFPRVLERFAMPLALLGMTGHNKVEVA